MTADTEGAIVYAPEMRIAHLADDHRPKAAPVTDIEQVCWRLIDHPVHPQAGSPKVAHLVNVAWLDVATILEPTTQADGKYKVQWRINLNGARPDPIVVGTEFRAVVFSKDEDPSSETITQQHEAVISFKPASVQELMQHTDRPNSVPGRPTSMREAMELESTPGKLKSGLQIESVKLIRV
ncbi:hypothetical protein EDD11_006648 [Mortierella claussenii]|nr:hypothetical protein EDD11_006648 [Mortierella claussenii]